MKLDRLILVNWGQIPPGDYDMGDMTLLTGETGSGKSTMLDGLQTIMTAAFNGILNYNPGQDEVTQGQRRGKSKRSVESYVVGAEYSKFSRPDGAQGYVAAVFRPDKNEPELNPFTAVIAVAARVDGAGEKRQAKLESFFQLIVDGAALSYSDFMVSSAKGTCIPTDQILRALKNSHPRIQEFHDRKKDYLSALYGRFRGKNGVTWDEAYQAARAWVQSIAYRPIGSVHELVRDEILDFDAKQLQQDVERISGLMRQVANLREEGQRLQTSVSKLDALAGVLGETAKAHEDHVQQGLLVARLQHKIAEERAEACRQIVASAAASIAEFKAKIDARDSHAAKLDEQKSVLMARLLGIPVAQQKLELERQRKASTDSAKQVLSALKMSFIAASMLADKASTVSSRPYHDGMNKLNAALQDVVQAHAAISVDDLTQHQTLLFSTGESQSVDADALAVLATAFTEEMNAHFARLYDSLTGSGPSLQTALTQELVLVAQRMDKAGAAVLDLGARKARLVKGGVTYPREVENALQRIRENFPEANALVLCDLVEPVSEVWQPAIEGYLGGARFNVIVDTQWERKVMDVVRAQNWRVNIVQGSLCLREYQRMTLPSDSIVHELRTENPIAKAYLIQQFGPVVKVPDTETLRTTRRGVTKDGKGAGSHSMYLTEARDLVFGQKARERQLEIVTQQLEDAEREVDRETKVKKDLDVLQGHLKGLKEPRFEAGRLSEIATEIRSVSRSLESLDLSETVDLETQIQKFVTELGTIKSENQSDSQKIFGFEERTRNANLEVASIESKKLERLDNLERHIGRTKALVEANPAASYAVISNASETALSAPGLSLESARSQLDLLSRNPPLLLSQAREAVSDYHQSARPDERFIEALPHQHSGTEFDSDYPKVVALMRAVAERLSALRSIGLYNNRTELETAVTSFNDVFTKNFCAEIKSKVDDGIRTLKLMNGELKSLKFGADRFSIDWSRWEPEFEEYLDFFNAVYLMTESAETLDLFGENELSEKHQKIRDRLVKLLLDDDQERATRELLRIADYRNYRRYDIFNESDSGGRIRLSEWGTGSGGQLETPAYIVRAAVVTNRLKLFERGPSLKLLVNDESFAKMDETRARAVLGFLRDNLDLQLISAMPTMKAGALKDEFNREYSFTRLAPVPNGELDFMSELDERIFKTDKMRELWSKQRVVVREQARQLFDETKPPEVVEPAGAPENTVPGA
ncbi:MAG: SbcC/MukB-like Walker B domain-containing protein [Acidovorax sp.]|uniref:SbcC/MukB-like Walker B domain-containing protein n=1 Tax=Acidovorax sp. TaxID=1872122 RepID=UPI0022CA5707|nr:SbcC/MukB-like Walker B domain-containing protein [Acidovorax sp.]MCZ8220040.1 SbcC/MukB-like Walker B domain-containing protein [Acidovorax sp.]